VLHDGLIRGRGGRSIDPSRAYAILTIRLIAMFNLLYRLADNWIGVEILRAAIRWMWGQSLADLIDREAPDLVVSTHSFFSPATHAPTRQRPRWVTVVTDLGVPPRVWLDPRSDVLIVPSPSIAKYARSRARVPFDRIIALDYEYPVDSHFEASPGPRRTTGTILLLGGGVGAGAIPAQVAVLRRCLPSAKIVVVCGLNAQLKAQLARQADEKFEVHGFVDRLDTLMQQSDLVVSKAGPATIAEAAILRKPLVITGWVGLQEKENVKLVVERGLGLFCPRPHDLPAAIHRIYQSYESFCTGDRVFRPGALKIARFVLSSDQS
jgi:1,2-diacylglycerol 3-beta-galactosyltransferase